MQISTLLRGQETDASHLGLELGLLPDLDLPLLRLYPQRQVGGCLVDVAAVVLALVEVGYRPRSPPPSQPVGGRVPAEAQFRIRVTRESHSFRFIGSPCFANPQERLPL